MEKIKKARRAFLKSSLALGTIGILGLPKPSFATSKENIKVPPLPWKYVELDPEYVRKLGHLGFYLFECSGATFWAIITALKEKIGYPYTLIPLPSKEEVIEAVEMEIEPYTIPMQYGFAGINNWGTLCGTLNGSFSAINYFMNIRKRTTKQLISRLFLYYQYSKFPTDISNRYATEHKFLVPKYKTDKALPQSISYSPLCHVSVSRWCYKSGFGSKSKERSERCARLAGDIAAMAVTLANAAFKGKLGEVLPIRFSHNTAQCTSCHKLGTNYERGEIIKGKMECLTCHRDLRPHMAENKLRTAFGVKVGNWVKAAGIGSIAGIGAHVVARRIGRKDEEHEEGEG